MIVGDLHATARCTRRLADSMSGDSVKMPKRTFFAYPAMLSMDSSGAPVCTAA